MLLDNDELIKAISLFLVLFSVIIIVLAIVFVHTMPGKIARKRNHPQVEAIEITSLIGLLIFPFWMGALIWAYIKPFQINPSNFNEPEMNDKPEPASGDNATQPENIEQNPIMEQGQSSKRPVLPNAGTTKPRQSFEPNSDG